MDELGELIGGLGVLFVDMGDFGVGLFVDKAHLALNDGSMFGKEGEGFMRLNIACPHAILSKALEQLEKAYHDLFE